MVGAWWHPAITWTNVDIISEVQWHLPEGSVTEKFKISINEINLKMQI